MRLNWFFVILGMNQFIKISKKTKHLKLYNSNIDTYKAIKLSFKILSDILQGVKWSYSIFLRFLFFSTTFSTHFFRFYFESNIIHLWIYTQN